MPDQGNGKIWYFPLESKDVAGSPSIMAAEAGSWSHLIHSQRQEDKNAAAELIFSFLNLVWDPRQLDGLPTFRVDLPSPVKMPTLVDTSTGLSLR